MIENKRKKYLITIAIFTFAFSASAYVASSTNYRIETDAVSFGGGKSTSDNYIMQDSLSDTNKGKIEGDSYIGKIGYLQMVDTTVSVSYPSSVEMAPSFSSASGGQANGTAAITATTDSPAGYTLSIKSATSPALQGGGYSFADFGSITYTWSVSATESKFGISVEGTDTISSFKDDGATCGTGALNGTNTCWSSIGTGYSSIAQSSSANQPTGTITNVKFRAEAGASRGQPAAAYEANITATAVAN